MRSFILLSLLCVVQATGCRQDEDRTLEVKYIANEGFMVSMGRTKVLIDPLPRSAYYLDASAATVDSLTNGLPPFDNIDYVLVTHDHPDHFNAELMSRFLVQHPAAHVVASSGTCGILAGNGIERRQCSGVNLDLGRQTTISGEKAEIVALRLEHGGWRDVNNLAYIVRSNGYTIMHVGDARLSTNEEWLRTVDWASCEVDLLFIEYFDQSSQTQELMNNIIKPKHVILMHIPPGEEGEVRNERGQIHPNTVVFERQNETRRFDTSPGGGSRQ